MEFTQKQKQTISKIYNTLKKAGFDDISIAGILGNALSESSFDPDSVSKSGYRGLWQNSKDIHNAVVKTYGNHNIDTQLRYLIDWANGSKNITQGQYADWLVTGAGKFKKKGYKTVYDASDAFMKGYERPIIKDKKGNIIGYQKHGERRNNSTLMYDYIASNLNPQIVLYTTEDGKKVMKFPMPDYTKEEKRIQEVPLEVLQNNTVYPPAVATPEYLNPYNNADSPAYGGTNPRIRGIQELTDEERRKYNNLLPEVNAYGKQPSPFALPTLIDMMNDGKEKWVRNITGMPSIYDEQSGPTINLFKIPTLYANKGKDLPKFSKGKPDDPPSTDETTYNVEPIEGPVIKPKKRSKYAVSARSVANPADISTPFDNTLTKEQILEDTFISNAANLEEYMHDVYKRKKGVDWDSNRGAYYEWLGSKPFLRNKNRREILEGKYRNHVNTLYGQYALDIADAINYVNGYYNSSQYLDRIQGNTLAPINGVAEGRKFLSLYPTWYNAAWKYTEDENGEKRNTFYIPKTLEGFSDVYPGMTYDPYFTMAHEYAHYMQAKTRGIGNNAFNDRDKNLFDRRTNVTNEHDTNYNENYADLMATRADMYRRGYIDKNNPYGEVTLDAIKDYRNKYGSNNRFFKMYKDEDIRSMYNTIAQNQYTQDNSILYANKGKDLPKYAPGKDEELVERGGVVYNVHPSALTEDKLLNVTVPNTIVRSNPGALQARDIRNENARIMAARFLAQHPFGANKSPVEPGLELVSPEFEILSLIGGLANMSSKAARQAAKPHGSPNAYKDIAKDPYTKELFGKYFSRQQLAYRALQNKKPTNDVFEGLPDYIKGNRFYGTDYDELPEDVYNIVKQSSYDRLRAKRPWLTDEEFDKQFAQAIKGGFSEYPEETFIAAGRSKNGGLLFPSNGHIAIREGYVNNALPHEVRHRMQQAFPHTQAEEELIEPAFGLWWYDLPKKYPELSSVTDDIGAEIDTSILDFRRALIGDTNLSRMAKEQQNNFMANTSLSLRRRAAQSANGYLRKGYEDKLSISQEAADEWVNLLVEVAKQLGAYSAPVVSGAALYNLMQQSDILPKHKKGKDLPKYGMGEDIINAAVDFGKGVTPIYGTYLDAKEFYNNPSPETLGYLALSALSDGLLLSGAGSFLGMGLKSLRGARAASRAAKALSVTPGKHLARYSAKTAEAARLKKEAAQQLTKGVSVDIAPQAIQTYKKYAE